MVAIASINHGDRVASVSLLVVPGLASVPAACLLIPVS
jgi:hypothetical protein